MKKEWIKIISDIAENIEDMEQIKCPNCGKNRMDYMYIGDENTRIGFLQIWCNKCLKGIYISRAIAPLNSKFVTIDSELEGIIPEYELVKD